MLKKLHKAILHKDKATLSLAEFKTVLFQIEPYLRQEPSINLRISEIIGQLEAEGLISCPKGKKQWDYHRDFRIPKKIVVIDPVKQQMKLRQKNEIERLNGLSWHPLLSSACSRKFQFKTLQTLEKINSWLVKTAGQSLLDVPIKERSLQILNDEKGLDQNLKSGVFFHGLFRLQDLNCFYVPEPLPYEPLSWNTKHTKGKNILVVENSNTYHSFCTWNRTAKRYAAVAYCKGNLLHSNHEGLEAILARTEGLDIVYFGDIDPHGLNIPYTTSGKRVRLGLQPILPAYNLYKLLLKHGTPAPLTREQMGVIDYNEVINFWVSELNIAKEMEELLNKKHRLAQEWLGHEVLMGLC